MEAIQIAIVEKSEIALQWATLGFNLIASKVKVEFTCFKKLTEFKASHKQFDLAIFGSAQDAPSLEELVELVQNSSSLKEVPCFYMCAELTSEKEKLIPSDLFKGVWQKVFTTSSEIEKDILNFIPVPYLIFNKDNKRDLKKSLVVDDVLISLKAASKLAKSFNFEVEEALNGTQAIQKAKENPPDIIFMDFEMPETNGLVATERIKVVLPETIIIGLSAHNKFDVADRAISAGMDALIEKPIKKKILNSLVKFFSNT